MQMPQKLAAYTEPLDRGFKNKWKGLGRDGRQEPSFPAMQCKEVPQVTCQTSTVQWSWVKLQPPKQ